MPKEINSGSEGKIARIAVLYQAVQPPIIDGLRKPMKPGGYSDGGADIAWNLKQANVAAVVITPADDPNAEKQFDWVFPDTPAGIQAAIDKGANVLWANTVLFNNHPLETIAHIPGIAIVGQLPSNTEKYDNKWVTNEELRARGLNVAASCLVSPAQSSFPNRVDLNDVSAQLDVAKGFGFPLVIKPVRGRGSQGVFVVQTCGDLEKYIEKLSSETDVIEGETFTKYGWAFMVEQYLPRQEVTITVMPPGTYIINGETQVKGYWSLPVVKRFDHIDGIAPYNGVVPVTFNSSLLDEDELKDPRYEALQLECEKAAEIVGAKAPIRIDCRADKDNKFYMFDLNMKPNMTGPGRPGRENQDCLTAIAARSGVINWNYGDLILNMSIQSWPAGLLQKN